MFKKLLIILLTFVVSYSYGQDTKPRPVQLQQQGANTNEVLKWNGSIWAPATDESGTDSQTLSISNDTLSITGGNFVVLPAATGGDGIYGGSGLIPDLTYANLGVNNAAIVDSFFAIGYFPSFPTKDSTVDFGLAFRNAGIGLYAADSINNVTNRLVVHTDSTIIKLTDGIYYTYDKYYADFKEFVMSNGTGSTQFIGDENSLEWYVKNSNNRSYFIMSDAYVSLEHRGAGNKINAVVLDENNVSFWANNTSQGRIDSLGWGVKTVPTRTLDVNGEVRIQDLTTTTPTLLLGSDVDGVLSAVKLGTNLSLSNDTLNAAGSGSQTLSISSSSSPGAYDLILSGNPDTVIFAPGAGFTLSLVDNELTWTYVETDGSVTNEGSLDVAAGGSNSSAITSNTSGSPAVFIAGGANVTITENADTITIAASGTSLADADYGDIDVTSSGTVWTVDTSAINSLKIQDATIANADLASSVGGIYKGSGSVGDVDATLGSNNVLTFKYNNTIDAIIVSDPLGGKVSIGSSNSEHILTVDTGKVFINSNSFLVEIDSGNIRLYDSDETHAVNIRAPHTDSLTASYTLTLPKNDGDNGQVLSTNGSGLTSWVTVPDQQQLTLDSTSNANDKHYYITAENANTISLEIPIDGAADGNGIYDGNGTVPTNTTASITDYLRFVGTDTTGGYALVEIESNVGNEPDLLKFKYSTDSLIMGYGDAEFKMNSTSKIALTTPELYITADSMAVTGIPSYIATDTFAVVYGPSGYMRKKPLSEFSGTSDHGALTGLTDDDHSQYLLLAGRAGDQVVYGGTASQEDLYLHSTADATKGTVFLNSSGGDVEIGTSVANVAGRLKIRGLGTTSSTNSLGIENNSGIPFFVINDDKKLGIGQSISNPTGYLTVNNQSGTVSSTLYNQYNNFHFVAIGGSSSDNANLSIMNVGNNRGVIFFQRATGTTTTPTTIADADIIGSFVFAGYDGTAFRNVASIEVRASGTVSTGVTPMRMEFQTGTTSSRSERMSVEANGNIGIGKTSASPAEYILDINSTNAIRLPQGLVGTRPAAAAGLLRYNTTDNALEYSTASDWIPVGAGITDGDKGDVDVTSGGSVWTVDTASVDNVKLASGVGGIYKGSGTVTTSATATLGANQNLNFNYSTSQVGIYIDDNTGTSYMGSKDGLKYVYTDNSGTFVGFGGSNAFEFKNDSLLIWDSDFSHNVSINPPNLSGSYTLTLPTTDGNANEYMITDGSGNLSWKRPVQTKGMTIEAPTSSENLSMFWTNEAITITEVNDVVRGTTPSVTYNIRFASTRDSGSPTDVYTANRTVTSTSGSSTSSFNDATIPANNWVWVITSATSGTVNAFHFTIEYTVD